MSAAAGVACDVVASRVRWEEKRICAALDRAGVPYRVRDARRLTLDVDPGPAGWAPTVLVREGSLTRARYVAHALTGAPTRVLNDAAAIEVCGDKYLTSRALAGAGLPSPCTYLCLGVEAALEAMDALGYPVVCKPVVGSFGRLCSRIFDRETAETVLEHRQSLPGAQMHVFYVQEHVAKPDRDVRVVVVGGRVLGGTYRRASGWRTNVHRGARSEPFVPPDDMQALAVRAAAAVGAAIAGVDLVEDTDGASSVLEVNHAPEFQGFEAATAVDVGAAVAGLVAGRTEEAA